VRLSESKVENLHSKFGHDRPLVLELFAMYVTAMGRDQTVTDGQTDGWTKAMLITPFSTVGGIIR